MSAQSHPTSTFTDKYQYVVGSKRIQQNEFMPKNLGRAKTASPSSSHVGVDRVDPTSDSLALCRPQSCVAAPIRVVSEKASDIMPCDLADLLVNLKLHHFRSNKHHRRHADIQPPSTPPNVGSFVDLRKLIEISVNARNNDESYQSSVAQSNHIEGNSTADIEFDAGVDSDHSVNDETRADLGVDLGAETNVDISDSSAESLHPTTTKLPTKPTSAVDQNPMTEPNDPSPHRQFMKAVSSCIQHSRPTTPLTMVNLTPTIRIPRYQMPTESKIRSSVRTNAGGLAIRMAPTVSNVQPPTPASHHPISRNASAVNAHSDKASSKDLETFNYYCNLLSRSNDTEWNVPNTGERSGSTNALVRRPNHSSQQTNRQRVTTTPITSRKKNGSTKLKSVCTTEASNVDLITKVLQEPPQQRSISNITLLKSQFRLIKAFNQISNFMLSQICDIVTMITYDSNRVVFKQGDVGTTWFVILKGSVQVFVNKAGNILDSVVVATLHEGAGFGDLALVNDAPRAASIVTASTCSLLCVEKVNYDRIIKYLHSVEVKKIIYTLKKVPIFGHWDEMKIKTIAGVIHTRAVAGKEIVLKQGSAFKEIFFVFKGTFRVFSTPPDHPHAILLGVLTKYDYFGEDAIVGKAKRDQQCQAFEPTATQLVTDVQCISTVTVQATQEGGKLGVLSLYDAESKCDAMFTHSPLTIASMNHQKAKFIDETQIQQKEWMRSKNAILLDIIRVRTGDHTAQHDFYAKEKIKKDRRCGWK